MNQETLKKANEVKERIDNLKGHYTDVSKRSCIALTMTLDQLNIKAILKFYPITPESFKLKYLQNISLEISRLENELDSL